MKSTITLALGLMISVASIAQDKQKSKKNDKGEKASNTGQKTSADINRHERIIWAGTGVDLNEKSKDVKNIPDPVLASFRQYFPNQEIDNVRKYRGLYAITYANPIYTTTLIYRPDGTFVEARTVATESDVPSTIREKIKQKAGYSAGDIVMIESANKEKFYRVQLTKGTDNEFLFYNPEGEQVLYDY